MFHSFVYNVFCNSVNRKTKNMPIYIQKLHLSGFMGPEMLWIVKFPIKPNFTGFLRFNKNDTVTQHSHYVACPYSSSVLKTFTKI